MWYRNKAQTNIRLRFILNKSKMEYFRARGEVLDLNVFENDHLTISLFLELNEKDIRLENAVFITYFHCF